MSGLGSRRFPSTARFEQEIVYCHETDDARNTTVGEIQSTFSSLEQYRLQFYLPLLEEAKQDITAAYENSLGLHSH